MDFERFAVTAPRTRFQTSTARCALGRAAWSSAHEGLVRSGISGLSDPRRARARPTNPLAAANVKEALKNRYEHSE
jgi:hypothetical protein